MIVFPEGYSPDHEVKQILAFLTSHNLKSLYLDHILRHDIKVTRSSTNGSFLAVNVSIIIGSFLEVSNILSPPWIFQYFNISIFFRR